MKIAVIVEAFPALSQTFILNQITGLIDRGHEVDIYAEWIKPEQKVHSDIERYQLLKRTYYHPAVPNDKKERFGKALMLFLKNVVTDPRLTLEAVNIFKYGKYAASLRPLYWIVPFLNRRSHYDIIQCHFGLLGRKGMLLRKMGALDGKLITAFHGVDISQNLLQFGADMYDDLFADCDLLLPSTGFFRDRLIQLGCDDHKTVLHYLGIDTSTFKFTPRLPPADGRIRLATVARLTEKKGIEYSLQAIAKAREVYPNLQFDLIGDGHLRPSLEQMIHSLGLNDSVNLLGAKTRDELIAILNQAHLFLHPSVTPESGDQEGSPVAIQEAMAMGLPILSTTHAGIPELVEDGVSGFLVPERDADALAEKLIALIQHPERWAAMGQAGRARVEQQRDIERLNDRLVQIYQTLLSSGSAGAPSDIKSDVANSTLGDRLTPVNS